MRLIDANALMDFCQNSKSKTVDCNDIARFPTAYDVDAVIKQLEQLTMDIAGTPYKSFIPSTLAIEIVRNGGLK